MRIFEFPYVIITILVFLLVIASIFGFYFTRLFVKHANSSESDGLKNLSKINNKYTKLGKLSKKRSLVYMSISLDTMSRLHSDSKAMRIFSGIQDVLLKTLSAKESFSIAHPVNKNFVILYECADKDIKEYLKDIVEEINGIFLNNEVLNIAQVYFGYYTTNSCQVNFDSALNRAKQACTMAEDKGLVYYEWDSNNGKEFERKIKMENNIRQDIDNNGFILYYQPYYDAKSKKMFGAEVLSRLYSQNEGIVSPGTFLSAVKNVGLHGKFDYYVFEKNCKWISNNKEKRGKYIFSVNFSRQTLCEKHFADKITEIIEKYQLDYSHIAVEILEDKRLTQDEARVMTSNLSSLKEKGVLVLLDDFGSGYTSFADLANFDIDIVKIDRGITQKVLTDNGFLILKNIIKTAHDLGFKTLCEGIETQENESAVIEAGCDMLQGYLYQRPMSVAQLEELFDKE